MKIKYDKEVDVLYIELKKSRYIKPWKLGQFLIDFDKEGQVIGFEILGYSKTVPKVDERFSVYAGKAGSKFLYRIIFVGHWVVEYIHIILTLGCEPQQGIYFLPYKC